MEIRTGTRRRIIGSPLITVSSTLVSRKMLSPPTSPPRLPGYDLREPTEDDARMALQRVFGADRGTEHWTQACREAGLLPGQVRTTPMLERAVKALSAQGGAAAMVARSVEIRLRTYARLAATAGRQGA